jgi:hypothetical protein
MNDSKWTQLRGDGATQKCPPDLLANFKNEFDQLCTDAGNGANDRRQVSDDTRFCRWPGQSPDGKKHAEANNGEPAFPFEGASDRRERTADGITNEQVIIIMAALMRANFSFMGVPGRRTRANDQLASRLLTLWEWVRTNQLGTEWFVEWTKFVQWRQGDSPALAFMQVSWHQETALKLVTIAAEDVMEKALAEISADGTPPAPEDQLDLADLLVNEARDEERASLIGALWPEIRPDSAKRAALALRTEAEASFPYPTPIENRLKLKARRLFYDIFIPENTTDLKRARMVYVREWFTETELRAREAKGDFEQGFLDGILQHEGESGWKHWTRYRETGEWSDKPERRDWDKQAQRGLYEIITVMYSACNTDGIPGTYAVEYSAFVDTPATKQELIDYNLGTHRYPFVCSQREILTDKLWDSRGNSELSATEQNALKILHDMFTDNAQLSTVPPLEVPAARPKMAIVWKPMGQIRVTRSGEVKPMPTPQFPQAAGEMMRTVRDGLARYFGQMAESNPADLVRLYQQNLVDFMMLPVAEVMWMGLSLAQQFLPDEVLADILAEPGATYDRDAAEQDPFRVEASFEAGMLSLDYMKTVGDMITSYVLKWDTQQTVPRDEAVKWFLGGISPRLAARLTRPLEEANQSEVTDEENNFTKIASGQEPAIMEDGQNFQLRRETLLGIGQKNPEAFQALAPASRRILETRLKHFDFMLAQQQNAVIGLTGTQPALNAGTAPAAAA